MPLEQCTLTPAERRCLSIVHNASPFGYHNLLRAGLMRVRRSMRPEVTCHDQSAAILLARTLMLYGIQCTTLSFLSRDYATSIIVRRHVCAYEQETLTRVLSFRARPFEKNGACSSYARGRLVIGCHAPAMRAHAPEQRPSGNVRRQRCKHSLGCQYCAFEYDSPFVVVGHNPFIIN